MSLGAAVTLIGLARRIPGREESRHLCFLGGLYALLALEEVDYLGIFGGLIGRIDGIYAGSPHDLIRLATEGLLPTEVLLGAAGLLTAVGFLLWRAGFLQPRRLRTLLSGWP